VCLWMGWVYVCVCVDRLGKYVCVCVCGWVGYMWVRVCVCVGGDGLGMKMSVDGLGMCVCGKVG